MTSASVLALWINVPDTADTVFCLLGACIAQVLWSSRALASTPLCARHSPDMSEAIGLGALLADGQWLDSGYGSTF